MRYDDWDILLFPTGREAKVPMKEFKVACHVVPDGDFSHSHGSHGIPVMTCFIPSLPAATPFHISIHSWRNPEVSHSTLASTKHADLVQFEARIFVDGRQVGSTTFDRKGQWPHLMNSTFEFTKTGELEPLRFPPFRRELLFQNHWSPGDDLGRIKIIISEGFPRDSLTTPIERVKNIVAFAFQHAPLDILENNAIAWPNPQMWRSATQPIPTFQPDAGSDSHAHSPRRKASTMQIVPGSRSPYMVGSDMLSAASSAMLVPSYDQNSASLQRCAPAIGISSQDPFSTSTANRTWAVAQGPDSTQMCQGDDGAWVPFGRMVNKHLRTDTSMPDYISSATGLGTAPETMHLSGPSLDEGFPTHSLRVPTNTPTAADTQDFDQGSGPSFDFNLQSAIPSDLAASLTQSLLNQPQPLPVQPHLIPLPSSAIKSRKENRHPSVAHLNPPTSSATPTSNRQDSRTPSQSSFGILGAGPAIPSTRASSGSPASGPAFSNPSLSRHPSVGSFGTNLANVGDPVNPEFAPDANADKGLKRTCAEPDERRPSPGARLSSFGDIKG